MYVPNASRLFGSVSHSVRFDARVKNISDTLFQYFEMFVTDWKALDTPEARYTYIAIIQETRLHNLIRCNATTTVPEASNCMTRFVIRNMGCTPPLNWINTSSMHTWENFPTENTRIVLNSSQPCPFATLPTRL